MAATKIIDTTSGRLAGRVGAHGVEFLGVRYAVAHRFAPPVPVSPWAGVREATVPGPAAPQPVRAVAEFTHGPLAATAEECLVLNVYSPAVTGARPVFVWLHGGGFTVGHASASLYDGSRLAATADAVVVTLNYRLGSLGWLSHPGLAAAEGEPTGNWGLLDQLAALEWVRDNIDRFGGDGGRVTLAGQSAGALAVADLLVAPRAAGLFGRAILQSPPLREAAQQIVAGQAWAESLSEHAGGAPGFDADVLRSLPADQIVALHESLLAEPEFRGTRGGALPTVDAATLPRSPVDEPGARGDVEVLIGTTADEGTFFVGSPWRPAPAPEAIPAAVGHLLGVDDASVVLGLYRERAIAHGRSHDPAALLAEIATDAIVAEPVARWASVRASSGARVHRYRIEHPGAGPRLRATHTVEVPLLFGTWRDGGPGERLGGQAAGTEEVALALVDTWSGFINGASPPWEPVGGAPQEPDVGVFGGAEPFAVRKLSPTLLSTDQGVLP